MTNLDMTDVEDRIERAMYVLADCHEPDVAAARSRLASRAGSAVPPRRRRVRPEVWVTLAAASVAVVGVGALWAIGRPSDAPPESPAAQTDPPVAPSLAPVIPTPDRLAVLDPQPGDAPIRSDPVLDWVHGTRSTAAQRWFVRRVFRRRPVRGHLDLRFDGAGLGDDVRRRAFRRDPRCRRSSRRHLRGCAGGVADGIRDARRHRCR